MKKPVLAMIIFSLTIFLSSCDKTDRGIKEGIYKGIFSAVNSSGTEKWQTTIELNNGKYFCLSDSNEMPACGSGTYTFDKKKIIFNDENFWTANFDWNLILNGEYQYTFDGEKLEISSDKKKVGKYVYYLEKQ
jgi:hypothetical protein